MRKMIFNHRLRGKKGFCFLQPACVFISRFLLNSSTSFRPVSTTCPCLLRLPVITKWPVRVFLLNLLNFRSLCPSSRPPKRYIWHHPLSTMPSTSTNWSSYNFSIALEMEYLADGLFSWYGTFLCTTLFIVNCECLGAGASKLFESPLIIYTG